MPASRADDIEGGHPEDDPGDPEAVAKAICLRLLTAAPRPRAGLTQALQRRGIPPEVIEAVLDRFTEVGLVDDQAYAEAFVASRHRDRGLGAAALGRSSAARAWMPTWPVSPRRPSTGGGAAPRGGADRPTRRLRDGGRLPVGAAQARRPAGARGYAADIATSVVDAALAAYREEAEEF